MTKTIESWTTPAGQIEHLRALLAQGFGWDAIADALNDRFHTTRNAEGVRAKALRLPDPVAAPDVAPALTMRGRADGGQTVEVAASSRVTTLDELLDVAGVDREAWDVERWTANKWETANGDGVVTPLYQVKAALKPARQAQALARAGDRIVARVDAAAARRTRRPLPAAPAGDALFVATLYDLHIGKLAWEVETGSNYDSDIAVARAELALADLIEQAAPYRPGRVLFPFGQDLAHVDNRLGTTTAGTPQDRDTRYERMLDAMHAQTSTAIERLADEFGRVDAVLVTGNHGRGTEFALAKIVEAEFRRDPRVTVDISPRIRKYRRHGVTLLGLTHGDAIKGSKLATVMPVEARDEWAQAKYGEWLTGHYHKAKRIESTPVDSYNGIVIRTLRSLSGTDAWHYLNGYVGEPAGAEAFIYDAARGLRANLVHYCDVAAAEAHAATIRTGTPALRLVA